MSAGVAKAAARRCAAGAVILAAAGCAAGSPDDGAPATDARDPWEGVNRAVFAANVAVDRWALEPVAKAWVATVPEAARVRVHNVVTNATLPVDAANALLQGHAGLSARAIGRFAVNTTIGVGGAFDVATDAGLTAVDEDFGLTLAVWGVEHGPYLVAPLFGPTTVRDAAGRLADVFLNPINYALVLARAPVWINPAIGAVRAVDRRAANIETFEEFERGSVDMYAAVRSAYFQWRERAAAVAGGGGEQAPPFAATTEEIGDPFDFLSEDFME